MDIKEKTVSGVMREIYSDRKFVGDLSDVAVFAGASMGGTYEYQSTGRNQAIIRTHAVMAIYSPFNIEETIDLVFSKKANGTFRIQGVRDGKLIYDLNGTFTLKPNVSSILPTTLLNHQFSLNVLKSDTPNPTVKVGQSLRFEFDYKGLMTFMLADAKYTAGAYTTAATGESQLELSGIAGEGRQPFHIVLDFIGYMHGTFSMSAGDGITDLTGNFYGFPISPIVPMELKGRLLDGMHFHSQITGVDYPYEVYLPPGYDSSSKSYPVVYVTDGQWFNGFAYTLERKRKPVIMILINEGPSDSTGVERRGVDYDLPGAHDFARLIKQELVPFVESKYRTGKERTFFGHSLGGTLGAVLIADEPIGSPYFKNYILADGTFQLTPDVLVTESARYNSSHRLPINLCLTTTRQGNSGNVNEYAKRYLSRKYDGLHLINKEYRLAHTEIAGPSFEYCIDLIY